jgi:uncharacterized protein (TIGR03663 family)
MAWPEKLRRVPWAVVAIVLLAATLRLVALDLKAPHFDEGVNGWFADRLRETGTFEYTPDNFHGPWHFYTVFVAQSLLGRNAWALRLPVVLASVLTIWVLLLYHRWFGQAAVRWAALAFAVSPVCVFYGRYSIHEPWFVLFTALFTWGVIALWLDRDRAGLWAAVIGLAGMILNKETYVIHAGSLALAGVVLAAWGRVVPLNPPIARQAQREWRPRDLRNALLVALFLLVFFYSGNFFHPSGLLGPFEAMIAWTKTGAAGNGHEKTTYELLPFVNYYWLALLARYEWPALIGLLWSVRYAWPAPAVPRLLAILGGGVLVAYSIVPYKTPWCLSVMIWPWFLFFGAAVTATSSRWDRAAGALLLAVSLGMTLRLNFREYENDAEPYVYVQTYRSVDKLTGPLLELARKDPRQYGISGAIYLQSSYPLPWILGDFTNIGYHDGKIPDPLPPAQFHVIETARVEELRPKLGPGFDEVPFHLRSGLDECTVFFQSDLLPEPPQPTAEEPTQP